MFSLGEKRKVKVTSLISFVDKKHSSMRARFFAGAKQEA